MGCRIGRQTFYTWSVCQNECRSVLCQEACQTRLLLRLEDRSRPVRVWLEQDGGEIEKDAGPALRGDIEREGASTCLCPMAGFDGQRLKRSQKGGVDGRKALRNRHHDEEGHASE